MDNLCLVVVISLCVFQSGADERISSKSTNIIKGIKSFTINQEIESVCNTMRELDKSLTDLLTEPPEGGGGELMTKMDTYVQAAATLLTSCSKDKKTAFRVANDMLERGGPVFIDVVYDKDNMKQRFDWDKSDIDKLEVERDRVNILWYDIWRLYNNEAIEN